MIIAEIGVNHNGDMSLARVLIDECVKAGADAVKFQLFHIEKYKHLQISESQVELLHYYCQDRNIEFLCTPFDIQAVDFLAGLVPIFKIGSGQSNDQDFVDHVASKGKPIILSTGMSEFSDIRNVLGNVEVPVTLLHCVSLYPTSPEKANLRRMQEMMLNFSYPIGYSDHTQGIDIALAAKALGAKIIEKHVTMDKDMDGPDHKSSITPEELGDLVRGVKSIESALT